MSSSLRTIDTFIPLPPKYSLYNQNSQSFSDSTTLPPQGSGYVQMLLMVPKGWKELEVTYMPTFVADKTLTFTMKAADVTRA